MASLIVRRHSNQRKTQESLRDKSSDQENDQYHQCVKKSSSQQMKGTVQQNLKEQQSVETDQNFIGSDRMDTRQSAESQNLSEWVV